MVEAFEAIFYCVLELRTKVSVEVVVFGIEELAVEVCGSALVAHVPPVFYALVREERFAEGIEAQGDVEVAPHQNVAEIEVLNALQFAHQESAA